MLQDSDNNIDIKLYFFSLRSIETMEIVDSAGL